jgi:16S rRNA (adenine1518-N6/adenine1519-N6)-dimethyltransferase
MVAGITPIFTGLTITTGNHKMANEIIPKKSLGQHWLHEQSILRAIAEPAHLTKADTVLEIGPGLGTLTKILAEQAKKVVAIEFDADLARDLPKKLELHNVEVIQQDILRFDFQQLPDYKIVANIPYYLTSNLIRVISEARHSPEVVVLLVQKEVAERVTALPGAMSMLSLSAQFYWDVSLGVIVPAEAFTPPPKVNSQVIIFRKPEISLAAKIDPKLFFRIAKAGFSQRRKTLLNSLSAGLHLERETVQAYLDQSGIDVGRRAQTLSIAEWLRLYEIYLEDFVK